MAKDKLIFFVDATCDIPANFIKKHAIKVIGLRYVVDGEDGFWTGSDSKSLGSFYAKMKKGARASTSLVTYQDAEKAFEPYFKDGYDIIHLGLSSGLAQTYQNALNAGTDLSQKYGRRFFAPDTKIVTVAHLLILERMLELGNFDKIVHEITDYYKNIVEYFTVESLSYLHRGGRLSATSAIVGGILNIKPILRVNPDSGKLENIGKVVGRQKSIQTLADYTKDLDPNNPKVIIVHSDCSNAACELAERVKIIAPNAQIETTDIGIIIGTHTGPGTLGLTFRTK
jgi:DegV family protein with EDD domain